MSDIFQEVDEELREEKYKSIWSKYKYYIIGFIIILVLGIGFNAFWKQYSLKQVTDRSTRFFYAMEMIEEDKVTAISVLEEFAKQEKSSSEYNVLIARFKEAAIRRSNKDYSGALDIYEELSENKISIFYKDFAILSSAEVLMGLKNIKEAKLVLDQLISSSSDLQYIAKEYIGYIEINEGNISKAKTIFESLAEDATVSPNIKNRSKEILSMFP